MNNNHVAGCQKLWKCYEFLPNQCFVNIPKVTRVNVPLTVLIVYHVPLWYKKINWVSIFCVSHSSCTKNCLNMLEVFQLTLSCSLKYPESWRRRGKGRGLVPTRENLLWKACIWRVTVSVSGRGVVSSRDTAKKKHVRTVVRACDTHGGVCESPALKIMKIITKGDNFLGNLRGKEERLGGGGRAAGAAGGGRERVRRERAAARGPAAGTGDGAPDPAHFPPWALARAGGWQLPVDPELQSFGLSRVGELWGCFLALRLCGYCSSNTAWCKGGNLESSFLKLKAGCRGQLLCWRSVGVQGNWQRSCEGDLGLDKRCALLSCSRSMKSSSVRS